jgi:flavodoxin
MKMKQNNRMISLFAAFAMVLGLSACGAAPAETNDQNKETETLSEGTDVNEKENTAEENTEPAEDSESQESDSKVLIAYFSATGTTKGVAEKIAAITGGDLYEIQPAVPYTDDDLNYNDSSTRATVEQNDQSVRPEIGSDDISLEDYQTVYLGYPIWWEEEPRIMDTFVEKYSFEGITVIPFCTSGGSGIGRSGSNLEALAKSGTWLEGRRFSGNVSESDLQSWIDSMN